MNDRNVELLGDVAVIAESPDQVNELEQLILDHGIFEYVEGISEDMDTDNKVLLPTAKGFCMGRLHDETPKARAKRKQRKRRKRKR